MAVESSFSVDKPHFPFFIGAHLEDLFEISGDNDAAGVLNRFEVAYVRPEILHLRDYHETLTLEDTVAKIVDALKKVESLYPEKEVAVRTNAANYRPGSDEFVIPLEDRPSFAQFFDTHVDEQIRGLGAYNSSP